MFRNAFLMTIALGSILSIPIIGNANTAVDVKVYLSTGGERVTRQRPTDSSEGDFCSFSVYSGQSYFIIRLMKSEEISASVYVPSWNFGDIVQDTKMELISNNMIFRALVYNAETNGNNIYTYLTNFQISNVVNMLANSFDIKINFPDLNSNFDYPLNSNILVVTALNQCIADTLK